MNLIKLKGAVNFMKTLVVYYSMHKGNTRKIAGVISKFLGADLIEIDKLNIESLNEYDLVGFGSGIYNRKHHVKIYQLIDNLNLENKNVFVFSTSAAGFKLQNNDLIKYLNSKGAIVKNSFSCKGYYTNNFLKLFGGTSKGHPNNDDILNAQNFANDLLNLNLSV